MSVLRAVVLCPHKQVRNLEPLDSEPLYDLTPCPRLGCEGGKEIVLRLWQSDGGKVLRVAWVEVSEND